MKTLLLSVTFIFLFGTFAFTQVIPNNNIPEKLAQAFNKKFPRATNPTWEMNKDYYEVTFTYELEDEDIEARFDLSNNWIATVTDINKKNLPESVKLEVFKEYKDFTIKSVSKLETQNNVILYEIEMEDEYDHTLLIKFSEDGKIVEKKNIDVDKKN